MGMHDIEDIVEWSVLILDEAPSTELLDKRSIYAALYGYQSEYDTNYTHFRVMAQLLAARFAYAFPVEEHPRYAEFRKALNGIKQDFVRRDPRNEWDEVDNPAVGFLFDPHESKDSKDNQGLPRGRHIYFDAGSELWREFVDAGKLTGMDALPPMPMSIAEVAAEIVTAAARDGEHELIRGWLAALYWDVDKLTIDEFHAARAENRRPKGRDLAVLKANPYIRRVRTYAKAVDALSMDFDYGDWGVYAIPTCDDIDVSENAAWWFDLAQDTDDMQAIPRAPKRPFVPVVRVFERHRSVLPQIVALIVCIVFGALLLRQRLQRRAPRWRP